MLTLSAMPRKNAGVAKDGYLRCDSGRKTKRCSTNGFILLQRPTRESPSYIRAGCLAGTSAYANELNTHFQHSRKEDRNRRNLKSSDLWARRESILEVVHGCMGTLTNSRELTLHTVRQDKIKCKCPLLFGRCAAQRPEYAQEDRRNLKKKNDSVLDPHAPSSGMNRFREFWIGKHEAISHIKKAGTHSWLERV